MRRNIHIPIIFLLVLTVSCNKYEYYEFHDYTTPYKILTFTDSRDAQSYNYVKIGDQYWMAENLNYKPATGSFVYDDNEIYANTYGRFYDWETARNVCPAGWHLPSEQELSTLIFYLGGNEFAGGQLKEKGTAHWKVPNSGASNISGFTALPGGIYLEQGYGYGLTEFGEWWTSTTESPGSTHSLAFDMAFDRSYLQVGPTWKSHRLSVRCIKNK